MRRTELGIRALAVVAVLAVVAGSAYVFVRPWRRPTPGAHVAALDYLVPDGGAARVAIVGPDGKPAGTQSGSWQVLPGLRALTELPKAFVRTLRAQVTRPGRDNAQTRADFAKVTVLLGWSLEVDDDGTTTFSEGIHLVTSRGSYLLGYTDTGNGPTVLDPPMHELPATPRVGSRWTSKGKIGAEVYRSSGRVVARGPQQTAAGRNPDCITIENRFARGIGAPKTTTATTDVYCRRTGGLRTVEKDGTRRRYTQVAVEGHPSKGPRTVAATGPARPPKAAPATWRLARVTRLEPAGSVAEPGFAPEPIATDPPLLVTATEHRDGIRAVVASGPGAGRRAWSFATGGRVYGAPRYDPAHGRLFFGASDRKVYGLDARGLYLWSFRTEDNVAARPALAGDLVVVAGEDGHVYGLDAATGRLRWSFAADAAMVADPVVVGGVVVVGTDVGTVYGIDVRHGTERWSHGIGAAVQSPIAAVPGGVVVTGAGGAVERFGAGTGAVRWSADLSARTSNGAAVGLGEVAVVDDSGELVVRGARDGVRRFLIGNRDYVGVPGATPDGFLVARSTGSIDLVAGDGRIARTWDAGAGRDVTDAEPSFNRGPRFGTGAAYVIDRDTVVRRLGPVGGSDPASLPLRWIRRPDSEPDLLGTTLATTPVRWRNRSVILDVKGRLFAADPRTGRTELITKVPHHGAAVAAPTVVGDDAVVFFTGTPTGGTGTLVRVSLRTGTVRWSTDVAGAVSQPLVVRQGRVVLQREVAGGSVVEAFDLAGGDSVWSHPSTNLLAVGVQFSPPGPVAAGAAVFAGMPLRSYDLRTGAIRWTSTAPGAEGGMARSPDGRTVYLASLDDSTSSIQTRIVAVDAATGAVRWNALLPPGAYLPQTGRLLATATRVVVPADGPTSVIALDARTGALTSIRSLPAARLGTASLIGGQVWTTLDHGRTVVVDPEQGRVTALYTGLGDDIGLVDLVQSPARIGPYVLVAGGPAVFALEPQEEGS